MSSIEVTNDGASKVTPFLLAHSEVLKVRKCTEVLGTPDADASLLEPKFLVTATPGDQLWNDFAYLSHFSTSRYCS